MIRYRYSRWLRIMVLIAVVGTVLSVVPTATASGNMLIGSSDVEMTFGAGGEQTLGLRFPSVDLPAGAQITDAWIQFESDETDTIPTALTI